MPPASELERFHSEIHALTNTTAGHQPTAADRGAAVEQRFGLLTAALRDLDEADHSLALNAAEQLADRLLRRFRP